MVTIHSALCSPHLPISPSPHPLPLSELRTLHSVPPTSPSPHPPTLFPSRNSELGTRNFALSSPIPPPSSHSALSTLHSALREALG
uniref:Uncharacterized protein n=1 Tax=Desertifilum tharense IPPAS B-1220 TaxID=1781255 RepID=A0ACD5H159_9CYAN